MSFAMMRTHPGGTASYQATIFAKPVSMAEIGAAMQVPVIAPKLMPRMTARPRTGELLVDISASQNIAPMTSPMMVKQITVLIATVRMRMLVCPLRCFINLPPL